MSPISFLGDAYGIIIVRIRGYEVLRVIRASCRSKLLDGNYSKDPIST